MPDWVGANSISYVESMLDYTEEHAMEVEALESIYMDDFKSWYYLFQVVNCHDIVLC